MAHEHEHEHEHDQKHEHEQFTMIFQRELVAGMSFVVCHFVDRSSESSNLISMWKGSDKVADKKELTRD